MMGCENSQFPCWDQVFKNVDEIAEFIGFSTLNSLVGISSKAEVYRWIAAAKVALNSLVGIRSWTQLVGAPRLYYTLNSLVGISMENC